jgi:hypothetical protein
VNYDWIDYIRTSKYCGERSSLLLNATLSAIRGWLDSGYLAVARSKIALKSREA